MGQLLTENIWIEITTAAEKCKTKSFVAVAYFGKGGAERLPMKEGSKLVVDASESAVRLGQTCPAELLKLYNKGVKIYSKESLHAKVFVFGRKLFIGSTNVSSHSANVLQEAVFTSTEPKVVKQGKAFVDDMTEDELGPERIKKLIKIYRPPQIAGGKNKFRTGKTQKQEVRRPLFVVNLEEYNDYSEGYEKPLKNGTARASTKTELQRRHVLETFEYKGNTSFKEGDLVLQVVEEGKNILVSPPGHVIHIEKWDKGKKSFVFVEVPSKRRKNIKQVEKILDGKLLMRDGKRSGEFASKAVSLWQ